MHAPNLPTLLKHCQPQRTLFGARFRTACLCAAPIRITSHHVAGISLCLVLCLSLTVFLSACSTENDSSDLGEISENSHTKFAPKGGYQFQQLFESDDLSNYDQVEVGVGSLDFIDTSLVYANTNIEDIDTQSLEQGVIDASAKIGAYSGSISFVGFAQIDSIDVSSRTITVSHFGSTIENALNSRGLTLEIGQTALSEGQAIFSDVAVGDKIAISFYFPQENNPLFGFMWATTENGRVRLIEHPETFPETADSSLPENKTTIEENDLDSFDEAHRIEGVQIEKINLTLLKDGILDAFALDGPQQIILYSYANVESTTDKTATFNSLGANIKKTTGLSEIKVLIPTSNEHLFDGEATLSQIKPGDTVVIQLVLGYGENTLSSANVWLVDESNKVITQ